MRHKREAETQHYAAEDTDEQAWEDIEAWARTTAPAEHTRLKLFASPQFIVGIIVAIALVGGGIHMATSMTPHDEVVSVEGNPHSPAKALDRDKPQSEVSSSGPQNSKSSGATGQGGKVVVHVVGQVNKPGVVALPTGARVSDAVEKAGGLAGKADPAAVNLAREATDGEQIYVPARGETPPPAPAAESSKENKSTTGGSSSAQGLININTASAAELEELPGVGPSIAGRIIEHRDANGPFKTPESITDVKGIGDATLAKFRDKITV